MDCRTPAVSPLLGLPLRGGWVYPRLIVLREAGQRQEVWESCCQLPQLLLSVLLTAGTVCVQSRLLICQAAVL